MPKLTQPIKWHGGKRYLASWILSLMPPRVKNPNAPDDDDPGWLHYVEPYAGGLAVLLAQDPVGISEVVNDRYIQLSNFWWVLGNAEAFAEFKRRVDVIPFSQIAYDEAVRTLPGIEKSRPDFARVESAVAFFVHARQSMSGRMDSFAPLTRNRTRRGMNEQASAWLGAVEGLPAVHSRLQRVAVLGNHAPVVIRQQDGSRTLFYLDPPYLHETRTAADVYEQEMTEADHRELLECLAGIKGRFLLSGYRSQLYDQVAERHRWRRVEKSIDNKSGKGATKQRRTECIWMNYP